MDKVKEDNSSENVVVRFFKKIWFLLWKDNSFKGWAFSLLVIFVMIKFVFFPLLSLVTATPLPLAIVESCSMYHQGSVFSNFDSWWMRHDMKYSEIGINKSEFSGFRFEDGLNKGDIMFIVGVKPQNIKIGDIIIFDAGQQAPVIHRVIHIKDENGTYVFSTEGDNNNGQLSFEKSINQNQVVGKAVFRLAPYLGWIKLIFFEYQKPIYERGLCHET
jgi:hypothetical protein